jgi:hypothetical protein
MGLLFLLAGYFVPEAYDRKGFPLVPASPFHATRCALTALHVRGPAPAAALPAALRRQLPGLLQSVYFIGRRAYGQWADVVCPCLAHLLPGLCGAQGRPAIDLKRATAGRSRPGRIACCWTVARPRFVCGSSGATARHQYS